MSGKWLTKQQTRLYMSTRKKGCSQATSAAKAGISERSGRRVEKGELQSKGKNKRDWKTRIDPFSGIWEHELEPMLKNSPELTPITLLEYLQSKYPCQYGDSVLRTLQRRVKEWRALYGEDKELIFRQTHIPGQQGLSDFTQLKDVTITVRGKELKHLLYHFRLAYSGWSHLKVILGGESYTALTEGLQESLRLLGGSPLEHRTDSLSAAFKNLSTNEKDDITERYNAFCTYYKMKATRNNRGVSHENGSIESPHGHLKRRIKQALLLRGTNDFKSVEDYQLWIDEVVKKHNQRNAKNIALERTALQALPFHKTADYTELVVPVHTTSTIDVRRTTYSVPSRLIGERLRVHLYHDRLECYVGSKLTVNLSRVYSSKKEGRGRLINYRHLIGSLIKKPQAFRFSQLRDSILPTDAYKSIWRYLEKEIRGRESCKIMVGLLNIASKYDCEQKLGAYILELVSKKKTLSLSAIENKFNNTAPVQPDIIVNQHKLSSYNKFLKIMGGKR